MEIPKNAIELAKKFEGFSNKPYVCPGGTGATGASGTADTGSTIPTAFAPKYVDAIICTRD